MTMTIKLFRSHCLLALSLLSITLVVSCPGSYGQTSAIKPSPQAKTAEVAPRTTDDMLARIKKSGKLRVGISDIAPWAIHDKDGNLMGFSVDVARKLARDIGVEVEFHPDTFKYLIPDLLADRFDIIISGFSIEPQRALLINFSNPFNTTDVTLAANIKTAGQFTTLQEFNKPTLTIGSLEGTTAEEMTSTILPEAQIKTYSTDAELFNALVKGKIDVAAADNPRPELVAKFFPDKVSVPAGVKLATFPSAFAVRRGDMGFINFLNSWICSRTANDWLEDRKTYWFKTTDWSTRL
jgi:polar amino acid transport system substrate-binding protein